MEKITSATKQGLDNMNLNKRDKKLIDKINKRDSKLEGVSKKNIVFPSSMILQKFIKKKTN